MIFSSMLFLWVFLPISMVGYYLIEKSFKNIFLLFSSLIFYAWGEPKYIFLMIIFIFISYCFGIFIGEEERLKKRRYLLLLGILIQLMFLIYFKYFNFIIQLLNTIFNLSFQFKDIALPVGISFYTFQSISYIVDVYREKTNEGIDISQRNIFDLALYISLFPQLIAGPIIKYHDIDKQIRNRKVTYTTFAYGIKRFIYGLSKKVLISNILAQLADNIFNLEIEHITTPLAWIGIICYTFQIYFDFSGYSDMAIGLGKIFGFNFLENFNYPYISSSIQEFWRRWHISLSTWFKEYVYIPLGGNRKGTIKTYRNLLIVFFVTGIWHGASINFIIWGLFHGMFIVIERFWLGNKLKNNRFKILNHFYVLMVVMIGWVFFRIETLSNAIAYLSKLFVIDLKGKYTVNHFITNEYIFTLLIAFLFCGLIQNKIPSLKQKLFLEEDQSYIEVFILMILLLICIINIASGAYNPFIYFRF